jgi:hypothetical protein
MASPPISHVYDDFVNFVVDQVPPEEILAFKVSAAAQKRLEKLLERLKADEITPEEKAELDRMAEFDLLVGVLKARTMAAPKRK